MFSGLLSQFWYAVFSFWVISCMLLGLLRSIVCVVGLLGCVVVGL